MVTAPSSPLRIVFFGTPRFAVPTLEVLLRSVHPVVLAVTQPDKPRGRGQQISEGPVKVLAKAHGVPVLQPDRLREPSVLADIAAARPDLGVVAAYGRILPPALLQVPRLGLINVHASLLPRYRGAAPVHRAVMAGERVTGVTIMRIVEALDAGPMLARADLPIADDETSGMVEAALAQIGAELLGTVVDRLAEGAVAEQAQDESLATYAPRLSKDEGRLDWTLPSRAVHNLVRGLSPWPHAFTFAAGRRLVIHRTLLVGPSSLQRPQPAEPGTILVAQGDTLRVATGDGAIDVLEIQPEGRRPMPVRAFLAGHPLSVGSRLDSSPS